MRPVSGLVDVGVDLGPYPVDQPVQQLFLAAEMPIQRYRRDAKLGRQPPYGERVQALLVAQGQCPSKPGVEYPAYCPLSWDANRKRFVQDGSTPGAIIIDGAPYTLEGEPPIASGGLRIIPLDQAKN